MVKEGC